LTILRDQAGEISADIPDGAALVEFGARRDHQGSAAASTNARFRAYVPVDISGDFLKAQAGALREDFPGLDVYPVTADFTAPFGLPDPVKAMPKVGFSRDRPWEISNRMKPARSCAVPATSLVRASR